MKQKGTKGVFTIESQQIKGVQPRSEYALIFPGRQQGVEKISFHFTDGVYE